MLGMRRRETWRQIVWPYLAVGAVFLLSLLMVSGVTRNYFREKMNAEVLQWISAIQKNYPEISDREIVETLQNRANAVPESNLLGKYGYTEEMFYSEAFEKYTDSVWMAFLCLMGGLISGCLITALIGSGKKEQKVREIISYLRNIRDHIYDLHMEENSEDELSRLQNEVYKLAVLWQEASENSRRDSENLSRSLEDISHQLKTPLASIRIMLDNILEDPQMDEMVRTDFLQTISDQIDWLSALAIALLNLAKFDSGVIKMNPQEFPVKKLVGETLSRLSVLMQEKDVEAAVTGDTAAVLRADYKWQMEAVLNILKNCVEHSPRGGQIHICIEDNSLFLKLSIRDEGEGMEPEELRHIFERFYKGKNSPQQSVGIGLSFAKAIIEKENGFVTADSEKNEGTAFVIRYKK